jgi:hypothetical protein
MAVLAHMLAVAIVSAFRRCSGLIPSRRAAASQPKAAISKMRVKARPPRMADRVAWPVGMM